jgi:hypothetical protein
MNTAIDHYNLKITRLIYNMNAQTARSEPIVLGETAGFTLDDLSVKMLREWAAQVEHQYNSNVEMQEKRSLWSLFGHGMLETLQDFLSARDVPDDEMPAMAYPGGNEAAQRTFESGTSQAQVRARHEWHIKWLQQLRAVLIDNEQQSILRIISEVGWRQPQWCSLTSTGVLQLLGKLRRSFSGLDVTAHDRKQVKGAILDLFESDMRIHIEKGGSAGEEWDDMLRRVIRELEAAARSASLLRAAAPRGGQNTGRDAVFQPREHSRKRGKSRPGMFVGVQIPPTDDDSNDADPGDPQDDEENHMHSSNDRIPKKKHKGPRDGSGCWKCGGDHFSRECPYASEWQSEKGKGKGSFNGGGKGKPWKGWQSDYGKGGHNWQWQRENNTATDQPRDANASGKGSAKGA